MIFVNGVPHISLLDASLYIDITCHRCKRLVALSNAMEIDGRRYCGRCGEVVQPIESFEALGELK